MQRTRSYLKFPPKTTYFAECTDIIADIESNEFLKKRNQSMNMSFQRKEKMSRSQIEGTTSICHHYLKTVCNDVQME